MKNLHDIPHEKLPDAYSKQWQVNFTVSLNRLQEAFASITRATRNLGERVEELTRHTPRET